VGPGRPARAGRHRRPPRPVPAVPEFPEQALDVFRVNVASTAALLDHAVSVGARRFIYASSGGVYESRARAMSENTPIKSPGRLGHYLGSKLSGELLVQSYASHMTVVVLRFFFMYGPGQARDMLIPRLLSNVTHGRTITLQGPDGLRMNPVHVSDACRAVMAAMAIAESATINVAGPEVLSLREIGEIMGRHVDREPIFEVLPEPPVDLIGDTQLMRSVLHAPVARLADRLHEIEAEA
jgi:UDP-glucose 4-epimerase